jgi:hypothetical protein
MSEGRNHRPEEDSSVGFTPEELASIEEIAQEDSDVQPSADDGPVSSSRQPRQKARSTAAGFPLAGQWQIAVIRIVMAASGVGASVVSGYFAIARLGEFMPRGLAAILGAFIVAFAVIAFELVLVFVQRRSYFAAATFVMLWALVAVFTLNATIAGFYTFYTSVKHEATIKEAPENAQAEALRSLDTDETDLRARIDTLTLDLRANERTVQNTTGTAVERSDYGRVFYDAQTRIASDSKALDALAARTEVVRQKRAAILAATPAVAAAVKRVDYFEWAGGILHWRPATMELVSAIFPSVFIDLISSIGLAVALFLGTWNARQDAMSKANAWEGRAG